MSIARRFFILVSGLISCAVFILFSCGLEDYKFLPSLIGADGNITMTLNTRATIRLGYLDAGTSGQYYYFKNFVIYYRIYISDIPVDGQVSTDQLQTLNSGLYSDYWALNPYTTLDNNRSPSGMGSIFSGRKFYPLTVEGDSIDSLLGISVLPGQGSTAVLSLDFTRNNPGSVPSLTIGTAAYNLTRYNDPTMTVPIPTNGHFINSADLQDPSNISSENRTNLDVQDKQNIPGQKYTYTAMYILLFGRDVDLTPIYSAPTFIGIFRLPD
jgi:hypothetical protein